MYRSSSGEPPPAELVLTQHGILTFERMRAMMEPGVLDPTLIAGRRVRWSYTSTRSGNAQAKLASEALKGLHLELGAAEVIVYRGPWIDE